jgi:hypothetical protein
MPDLETQTKYGNSYDRIKTEISGNRERREIGEISEVSEVEQADEE